MKFYIGGEHLNFNYLIGRNAGLLDLTVRHVGRTFRDLASVINGGCL